jgi:phospholipid/cholesterol/gamma-HCH transport system ATP-binding protein
MSKSVDESSLAIPAIEFRHVSLGFEGRTVLDDVSFELSHGQMVIITGASNSGKSVLLHLAIGLLRPDEGEILIEGNPLNQLGESELLGLRGNVMGIAFQEDALFTGLSAFDNAAYRLVEHDWAEEDINRSVREIMRFVGLEHDMEKLPEELSIGMRRRLEIARALAGWPRIMLFDEPTSGLDPVNARMVLDLVIRARDLHNISILHATKEVHQIRYIAMHCGAEGDRGEAASASNSLPDTQVMVLDQGKIVFLGSEADFEASSLPAVKQLTDPGAGEVISDDTVADPWPRTRKHILFGPE